MSFLEIDNVSKHFGSLVAVNGVSMRVEAGELRAIIGPNGAGKTTFFNLISGFLTPSSGRIVFDGQDVTTHEAGQPRRRRHGADIPGHRDLPGTEHARKSADRGGSRRRPPLAAVARRDAEERGRSARRRADVDERG